MKIDLLSRLLPPPSRWDDPLFRTDARAVRWGESPALLRARIIRWGVQMCAFLALAMLGVALLRVVDLTSGSNPYYTLNSFLGEFMAFALLGSVGVNLLLDFVSISAGLNTISGEFEQRRADLLRLTLLRPTQIVESKAAVAQMRVLRMTFRIMWLRVWVVIFGIGALAWSLFDLSSRGIDVFIDPTAAQIIVVVLLGALTVATYVIEPYWRMKAVTALGIMQSSRVLHGTTTTLNAGFSLIGFWMGQGIVVFALAFALQIVVGLALRDEWYLYLTAFGLWAAVTGAIYLFYRQIAKNSLYQAAYRLATLEN